MISYRPGKNNIPADMHSYAHCGDTISGKKVWELHFCLCHPGATRFIHFIKIRNLMYFIEEILKGCQEWPECGHLGPKFCSPDSTTLIKESQSME